MSRYAEFHRRSIAERDTFWAEQARLIDWQTPPDACAKIRRRLHPLAQALGLPVEKKESGRKKNGGRKKGQD